MLYDIHVDCALGSRVDQGLYYIWGKIMKTFKTYRQQLSILRRRGLNVPKNGAPLRHLENINYYKLINGYKIPFLNENTIEESFKNNVNFDEILTLYNFDRELRIGILRNILVLETQIKSSIAYEFSKLHGHDNYLKKDSFDDKSQTSTTKKEVEERVKSITSLIASIQETISNQALKKDYIKHYLVEHGYIPLWVLINVFTLGTVSKFYGLMKQKESIEVARRFNVSYKELNQYIKVLGVIRNICAHDERLFNVKLERGYEIPDNLIHKKLNIQIYKQKYVKGKSDLFAVIIILKVLLSKREFGVLANALKRQISILDRISSIKSTIILEHMGFPTNWYEIVKS